MYFDIRVETLSQMLPLEMLFYHRYYFFRRYLLHFKIKESLNELTKYEIVQVNVEIF